MLVCLPPPSSVTRGEEWPEDYTPSPVFLVKKVKHLWGQPYWHKETCERIGRIEKENGGSFHSVANVSFLFFLFFYVSTGIGPWAPMERIAVVPNTPSMCYKLFSVKHLIEIIPLRFPMGFPSDEEFDPAACRINHKGEFYYHPKLKQDERSLAAPESERMKISEATIFKFCYQNWYKPFNSPFGNSNYDRDTRKADPSRWNRTTDSVAKIRFQEDIKKFSRYIK